MYKHGTAQLQQWLGQAQSGVAFGKQPAAPPPRSSAPQVHALAVGMETLAADGLASPPLDGRRRHVHYTHCRTNSVSDVQPDQITREK